MAKQSRQLKSRMAKCLSFFVLPLILLALSPLTARADTGPKPSLDIYCRHMPAGEVYLDLLIDEPPLAMGHGFYFGKMGSDSKSYASHYNSGMLNMLQVYNEDGWRPALVTGTTVPIWGDISLKVKDGEAAAHFSYLGVPKKFKVIVVSEDGKVVVSNLVERKTFQSMVDFDYATGKAAAPSILAQTAAQFAFTFPSTVLIEGMILLLFRFSLRRNWRVFLFTNLGTQLALSGVLWLAMATFGSSGTFPVIAVYLLLEIVILIVETALYAFLLKQHSLVRRIIYGITANLASFLAGMMIFVFTNFTY